MLTSYTLGIEEEFQTVNRQTGQLQSSIDLLLEEGREIFGDRLKSDLFQSLVEITTDVCADIAEARTQLHNHRSLLSSMVQKKGLALISSGTHPQAHWQDQEITQKPRYIRQAEAFRDIILSRVIFGLHIHVGVLSRDSAISLINQLRTWLPHLLALSANSPFWEGRYTGVKSYRSIIWQNSVRTGIPEAFSSIQDFDQYIHDLTTAGYIATIRDLWWDIRFNEEFSTIEFRICDMPATMEDTLALAALCQALVAKLSWLQSHGKSVPVYPRDYIAENKWSAVRDGLDGEFTDFRNHRRIGMRDSIRELLHFVDTVVDDLGSRQEINHLHTLLGKGHGTGADRQISVYQQTHNIQDVIQMLMNLALEGISVSE